MPVSGARQFLILHGWGGSGPDHWQSWLASRLRAAGEAVRFPTLPNPDEPRLEEWLAVMRHELASMSGSRIVVCHSLAVLLWLHHARQPDAAAVDRLLLVAPPGSAVNNPQVETFFPAPRDPLALHRTAPEIELVCSAADPFCPERADRYYGEPLGVQTLLYPSEAGHINVASGYGPWPWVESWCQRQHITVEAADRFP